MSRNTLVDLVIAGAVGLAAAEAHASWPICGFLHEHSNYGEPTYMASVGANVSYFGESFNDKASSLTVTPDCTLELWEDSDYRWSSLTFNGGSAGFFLPWIGESWNDRVSSFKCTCAR